MIHTRIDDPLNLRKDLLEAAIDAAEFLKAYERLRELEERRKIFSSKTSGLIRELTRDIDLLENFLPPLPGEVIREPEETRTQVSRLPERPTPRKRLEADIEEIRNKLSSLGFNR